MDCNICENVIKNVCNPKGTKKPKIYFVADCPSKSESESGISFSGEYSVKFHSMIDSYGLDENNCRFGYCVRCFPLLQNNDDYMNVLEQLFKDCKNILFDDIKSTNPNVIVALGTKATSLIVNNVESKAESADNYTLNIDGKEFKLFSLYHPKYVVENQRVMPKFYEKLSEALSLCSAKTNGILNENSSNTVEIYNYKDFDAFCEKYIDGFDTIGYDIETNALEVHHINYKVVGFSLASSKDVGCYVVLESIDFIMNPQDHKMVEDRLRDILLHKKIIVYNCMHELPATLNWLDIEIPDYEDLLIMVKLMMGNADAYVGNGGLKAQSVMHLHTMDWSKDLDEYASILKSYKNNYEESETKLRIILGKYYDGDMLDVIVRKSLYYAENVVPDSPEFSYGFVPCKLIARYGSIDSSILFELKDFYENWMTKEGKELGIDLFQGYKYWKWHHYAGYCLERNGAFWNDEKAKKIEKWCEDGKIECLRNIIKSPLMYKWILTTTEDEYCKYLYENYCDEMIDQTKFAIVKRYARGIGVKPLSTLAETELKQKSITPTKQGIYKLETQHILYMGREFVKSKSELRDKWTKEFIENIDNKSFDELKKVVNPGSTAPEFRDYLASVLITPITKVAKFYDNIAVMVDDPEFNIGNFVSDNKNSSDDIKVVSMIYKFKSSDVPISDRFDWFQSFITSESRVYRNYKIRKAKEDAINYTFANLDSKTFNTIYNLYLMCHIDVEDRSTWNKEFEWMYNYKMFKKFSKLLSTYIEGTVARANVYEVDKKSFSNGDILTRRERKYSKEHPIGDDKQYLMQTKFKVNMANTGRWTCFTGDTKIKSLDGNSYTFEELVNNDIDKFWVYSIDGNNNIVPGLAFNPHITDYVNEIIKIRLECGECIKCTPNHLFLMRDGTYKKASDIVEDDNLMPSHCVAKVEVIKSDKSIPVYDITVDKYHNFALDCGVFAHNCGMHNLPASDAIKGIFTSRFEGGCIAMPDGSQMEIRTLSAESKDEALLQAFADGIDIHRFFASKIYSVPYEDVQKWQRGLAKNAVFGMLYGESEQTFANSYLGGDLSKAKEVYNGLFTGFPRIKDYIERKHNQYLEKKKVTTLTQRFINLDSTKESPDRVLRQSQNFPIQASAEDIAGCILYKLCEWLRDNNMKSKPFCFIHDSIEIDMHPDEVFKILEKLDYLFNVYPREEFGVPVACDVPLSMSMGAEIDVAELKCNDDYTDITITLDGYEDDIEELIYNWKNTYKVCEQVIDYVPDEEDKKVYMPIAERFLPQKAPVSMKQGTYRNHIKRQYHIIVR